MTSVFAFKLHGSREGTLLALKEQKANAGGVVEKGDQTLLDAVKPMIEGLAKGLSENFNGIMVIADGQIDADTGRITAQIQIYGQKFHV